MAQLEEYTIELWTLKIIAKNSGHIPAVLN